MRFLVFILLLSFSVGSLSGERQPWNRLAESREVLQGAEVSTGTISLDLPGVTQDGSSVNLGVEIDHPMEADRYIEKVYVFADRNPSPEVLDLQLSPHLGTVRFNTRIRLNESQRVIVLARNNDGEWFGETQEVRVTISGCLSRGGANNDNRMQARARGPSPLASGETGEIRTLINHPMETGLREDNRGRTIPQNIIETMTVANGDGPLLEATFYRSLSANPRLFFGIQPKSSQDLTLTWTEDTGETTTAEVSLRVN
ncbi:MAG: thiosulfate oxidation carrier complex protein SoxZ [Opitutales bacterium]|nr:thiosulfate oxidation carrier complex protein SoxZ [Opitutales bacterium]MCH8541207.1 thiosulfate oxidation carrier complex protein SoxZ [Opitutales bacterium]